MSIDEPTVLRVLNNGRSRQHHDRLLCAGAAIVIYAIGSVSGFLVGLAAQPTIVALIERLTRSL